MHRDNNLMVFLPIDGTKIDGHKSSCHCSRQREKKWERTEKNVDFLSLFRYVTFSPGRYVPQGGIFHNSMKCRDVGKQGVMSDKHTTSYVKGNISCTLL